MFEKIRDIKEPISTEEFDELVAAHGDQPHDHDPEDWRMKTVSRHLYKILVDHTSAKAKQIVTGAPKRTESVHLERCER